jgi:hypothetical protein
MTKRSLRHGKSRNSTIFGVCATPGKTNRMTVE